MGGAAFSMSRRTRVPLGSSGSNRRASTGPSSRGMSLHRPKGPPIDGGRKGGPAAGPKRRPHPPPPAARRRLQPHILVALKKLTKFTVVCDGADMEFSDRFRCDPQAVESPVVVDVGPSLPRLTARMDLGSLILDRPRGARLH